MTGDPLPPQPAGFLFFEYNIPLFHVKRCTYSICVKEKEKDKLAVNTFLVRTGKVGDIESDDTTSFAVL